TGCAGGPPPHRRATGRIVERRVGEGEGGVPFGGESGVLRAALGESRAVDAEFARGEAGVAGASERGEEGPVLELLAAVERTRHGAGVASEILFFKAGQPSSAAFGGTSPVNGGGLEETLVRPPPLTGEAEGTRHRSPVVIRGQFA